jgi:hypothetical protein
MLIVASLLLACGAPDCLSLPDAPSRDQCLRDQIAHSTPDQIGEIAAISSEISDPLVRSMAVSSWIATNQTSLPRQQAESLCRLLHTVDANYCLRSINTPHLNRR